MFRFQIIKVIKLFQTVLSKWPSLHWHLYICNAFEQSDSLYSKLLLLNTLQSVIVNVNISQKNVSHKVLVWLK